MLKKAASLVVLPVLLLLWARLGSQNLALYSFNALVRYPSPYLGALTPGKEGQALTPQVVIVVVDALRADTSRTLPAINELRARGADRTLQVGQPSFSLPGWTVIGTGAWQETSGVTLNFYDQDIKIDTLFEAAKRKGLTTAIVGEGTGWQQLYPRGVDVNIGIKDPQDPYQNLLAVRRQDDEIETRALQLLKANKPNLLLVHFIEPDDAGHGQGASSSAYKEAAAAEDARIGRLANALDLSQATLFVTADHGMLDQRGHGGAEPEVMTVALVGAGKGIKPGKYAPATQADIASTLAVLLGTSIPAHNQGQPLFDMLDLSAGLRAQRAVDAAQELSNRYVQVAQVMSAPAFDHSKLDQANQALAAGNADAAYQAAVTDIHSTWAQAAAAKESHLNQERLGRLPVTLLIMLPFIIYLLILRRAGWDWRIPVAGTIIYILVYNALFFGRGLSWSLSMLNDESQITEFFTARTVDAMIALVVAALLVGVLSRKQSAYSTALNTVNTAFLIAWVLAFQIDLYFLLYNVSLTWYIPDLTLGLKYYLDLLQTGAFWPMLYVPLLVLLPFIALGGRWLSALFPPGQPARAKPQADRGAL